MHACHKDRCVMTVVGRGIVTIVKLMQAVRICSYRNCHLVRSGDPSNVFPENLNLAQVQVYSTDLHFMHLHAMSLI